MMMYKSLVVSVIAFGLSYLAIPHGNVTSLEFDFRFFFSMFSLIGGFIAASCAAVLFINGD